MNKSKSVIAIFLLLCLSITTVVDLPVVSAKTTTKTTTKTLSKSYSRRTTQTIDIPYATSVKNIRVNTGYVASHTLNKSTGKLTVTLDNGKVTPEHNEYKYSKEANRTITYDSRGSIPSSINVSEGNYKGTLYRGSITNATKTKYVSGTGLVQTEDYWYCVSPGTLTPNPNFNPEKPDTNSNSRYNYSPGKWNMVHNTDYSATETDRYFSMIGSHTGSATNGYYSDSSGYSGSVAISSRGRTTIIDRPVYVPTYGNDWVLEHAGKVAQGKVYRNDYSLSGNVSKPAYDAYFSGTIYAPGYDDTYYYTVTIEYEEDILDINLSSSNISWTNQNVNINANSDSYFFNKFTLNGTNKLSNPSQFPISSNGTYRVYVYDSGHGRSTRSNSTTITVSNIDKQLPSGNFSLNSRLTWGGDISTTFTPSDTGGSGVKDWRYAISTNEGNSYEAFSSYRTGRETIELTSGGKNKIKIEVRDLAGNVATIYSGLYYIDKVNPSLSSFNPYSANWTNKDINVNWSGTDAHSGISTYAYKTDTNTNGNISSTNWSNSNINNKSTTISKEGVNTISVQLTDIAGNRTNTTSGEYLIDKTKPTFDIKIADNISDTLIEIPITITNLKDNLSGVSKAEISLKPNFDLKYTQTFDIKNKTTFDCLLSRFDLAFEQTIYIKVTDTAGNISSTTSKKVYLDPLPPNIPTITSPENDTLIVTGEPLKLTWTYTDQAHLKLIRTDIIFKNVDSDLEYVHTLYGDTQQTITIPNLPQGKYNTFVKVYNSSNKSTESTTTKLIRKNILKTKELSIQRKFLFQEINSNLLI